ncbi:MAG: hypothetical protein Q7K57_28670 [Burkholderiaceae bacterium]|nr:hypothetical protein [Burkholderiaceae bacterium]
MEEDDEALRICHHCVGDKVLKREIRHDGVAGECSDCGKVHASWTIEQLAERIGPVFELHHQLTPTHPDEMEDSMLRHGMMNGCFRRNEVANTLEMKVSTLDHLSLSHAGFEAPSQSVNFRNSTVPQFSLSFSVK